MKVVKYTKLEELRGIANEMGQDLFDSGISVSFRIFKGRNCTELHIFYK